MGPTPEASYLSSRAMRGKSRRAGFLAAAALLRYSSSLTQQHGLTRQQLQALAKAHDVRANAKSCVIEQQLRDRGVPLSGIDGSGERSEGTRKKRAPSAESDSRQSSPPQRKKKEDEQGSTTTSTTSTSSTSTTSTSTTTTGSSSAVGEMQPIIYRYPSRLLKGKLIKRYKRFLADVELEDGTLVTAHCPNTGPMLGLGLKEEPQVLLSESNNPKRKLGYTMEMLYSNGEWVGIHSALANKMVKSAFLAGVMPELGRIDSIRPEFKVGESRIDFSLEIEGVNFLVEVKSVTLVEGQLAMFPDTVSLRAQKHARVLQEHASKGGHAAILFLIQRSDCDTFSPALACDPDYAKELVACERAGVRILPYRCCLRENGTVQLMGLLPYVLPI